jgi:Xaa-Pro aminopeptidase
MPESFGDKLRKIEAIARKAALRAPPIDKRFSISRAEFAGRRRKVWKAVRDACGVDVAFAFSDEHYSGDVPYLGGNTNYSIEQVAFGLGPDAATSGIIAGFEGVYIAGQLAPRAGVMVYPTESLQLADEKYPVEGFSLGDILARIAGRRVRRIGLLSPRQVVPAGVVANLEAIAGRGNVVDAQLPFQRIKNLKSDDEMRLLADAGRVTAIALRAMLAVTEPGMEETEIAAFGDLIAKWLGCERKGFETMAGSGSACVTMIGPALNRPVRPGAPMHFGASYKRDGLTACCRRSAFSSLRGVTAYDRYFADLVGRAFRAGFDAYVDIAARDRPARFQEQALVDFFNARTDELLSRVEKARGRRAAAALRARLDEPISGLAAGLARLKPYTGTHNAGYTECQEFYGAITLESERPLDRQVVTMLDVALRGRGSRWLGREFEPWIPGFDYWVIEDTLGKFGREVRNLTGELQPGGEEVPGIDRIPIDVQPLIGDIDEFGPASRAADRTVLRRLPGGRAGHPVIHRGSRRR